MGVSKFSPASQRGVDATPTASSTNLVESGGVKSALNSKLNFYDCDGITASSISNAVAQALQMAWNNGLDAAREASAVVFTYSGESYYCSCVVRVNYIYFLAHTWNAVYNGYWENGNTICGGLYEAAKKDTLMHDLANIVATGTTNTTGATIAAGTYFYLNGTLVRAKTNIANGATFTSGTNYEAVTAGGFNELKSALDNKVIRVPASGTMTVSASRTSTTIASASDSRITANHYVINAVVSNPSVMLNNWTVVTSAGSLVVNGSSKESTTLVLYLEQ